MGTPATNEHLYPLLKEQMALMVSVQGRLNRESYAERWLEFGGESEHSETVYDYPLAAGMEIAEFLNSWGYDWWGTKQWPRTEPIDRMNCMTELVDAWHFLMSQAIIEYGSEDNATKALIQAYINCDNDGVEKSHRTVVVQAKTLLAICADWQFCNRLDSESVISTFTRFFRLVQDAGFTFDHFYARYLAKVQLNVFRQCNGYKDKPRTYRKVWETTSAGEELEDNYFLALWIDATFADPEALEPTADQIMQWIAQTYAQKTGNIANTPAVPGN